MPAWGENHRKWTLLQRDLWCEHSAALSAALVIPPGCCFLNMTSKWEYFFFLLKGTHFSQSVGSGQVSPVAMPGLGIQSGRWQSGSVTNSMAVLSQTGDLFW